MQMMNRKPAYVTFKNYICTLNTNIMPKNCLTQFSINAWSFSLMRVGITEKFNEQIKHEHDINQRTVFVSKFTRSVNTHFLSITRSEQRYP